MAYAEGKTVKLLNLTRNYQPEGPARTLAREPNDIDHVIWNPNGKQIIYQHRGDTRYVRRVSTEPGSRPQKMPDLENDFAISEILADGSALGTETTQVEQLWRADLQLSPVKLEIASDSGCDAIWPGCSPDGSSLSTVDPYISLPVRTPSCVEFQSTAAR